MVFPGQGSQSTGMLNELEKQYPIIRETFDLASSILKYDLWEMTQDKTLASQLNQTDYTQPIMLTADVAIYRCWQQEGGQLPAVMAGHSLGEYSALVCANALSFEQAIPLVSTRAKLMTEAAKNNPGAMAAIIGIQNDLLNALCSEASGYVIPANFNSHGQTVIAGEIQAVEKVIQLAKTKGAKIAKKIPVSVPAHCRLMEGAAEKLRKILADIKFSEPVVPVLHNVDAKSHNGSEIKEMLVMQMTSAVEWVKTIDMIASAYSVSAIVECGPGKVLSGLNKRINKSLYYYMTFNNQSLSNALNKI